MVDKLTEAQAKYLRFKIEHNPIEMPAFNTPLKDIDDLWERCFVERVMSTMVGITDAGRAALAEHDKNEK